MLRRLAIAASIAGCSATPVDRAVDRTPAPPAEVTVTIIGTNDLHGHIEQLPIFAGHLANLARVQPHVVLVDGGDMFQGTLASNLTEGAAVVRAYNALGYEAAAVGNHEFDYGPVGEAVTPHGPGDDPRGALKARAAEATFPFLTANILDAAGGRRVDWGPDLPPTAMLEVAGLRVGVIGVSTADTLVTTISGNVADLAMAPLAETIAEHARRLRSDGAAAIVVSAHAGAVCDAFRDPDDLASCDDGEIFAVARSLEPGLVDVIVAGHTHRGVAHRVNGVAIIESFAYGKAFGRVDLTLVEGRVTATTIHPPQLLCRPAPDRCEPGTYAGAPVVPDPAIARAIAPDLARADRLRAEPVGVELVAPFEHSRGAETPLSRLLADLVREARKGDVGIINGGGIRSSLEAGPLHYGAFYEVLPFDNRFARVELTGAELRALIADDLESTHGILTFSGIRATARCQGGAVEVDLARSDGRPIRDDERLVVVTSDYLATSSIPVFMAAHAAGRVSVEDGEPMREAMVALLRARGGRLDPGAPGLQQIRIAHPRRPMGCR